jgi:hypothetical protein
VSEEKSQAPNAASAPVYADRATGQTFGDARAMVNAYLARFAGRAGMEVGTLDDAGYVQVRAGSAIVAISVMEDVGVLILLAPIMKVPKLNREALYRRLLETSFLLTSDAAFAIDSEKDEITVRALRRLSGLDYEEFEDLLNTVGNVADTWDDTLRAEFGRP